MNRSETVAAVARKLRGWRKRDVDELLDVLIEIWTEALKQPGGFVRIDRFGKLYVQWQQMRSSRMIQAHMSVRGGSAPDTLRRLYFRFSPARTLKDTIRAAEQESEEKA